MLRGHIYGLMQFTGNTTFPRQFLFASGKFGSYFARIPIIRTGLGQECKTFINTTMV